MKSACPRLVIAGTNSGVGKTSLSVALARSLARRGMRVQSFKVGPDFLDPTYLTLAAGRTCYNLDGWMTSREYIGRLFDRATADADIAIRRAALAIGTAYALALALPWGTHDYWILLTIVVVLRGSLAQTLERRNSRVMGTLIGCLLAGLLLYAHIPPLAVLVVVTLAQGFAHAFAVKRYLVTAVAATVLGLLQVHLLNAGSSASLDVIERMDDTLMGVSIAWAFSYVLPSWERHQMAALVARTLAAQARHARVALDLWQLNAIDNEPELQWRLARREAYDSLSALVQSTQRSLSEPRAVRPPLEPLGKMLAYSYQLLGQLTAVKTMLLRRRGRLTHDQVDAPLRQSGEALVRILPGPRLPSAVATHFATVDEPPELNDPFEGDLSAWLLRRLDLAADIADQLRAHADQVLVDLARAQDR